MILQSIHDFVRNPCAQPEDKAAFFWVEWNDDDDQIPGSCEAVLKTGTLSADQDNDETLVMVWRGARIRVPLTRSALTWLAAWTWMFDWILPVTDALRWPSRGDRQITLLALNEALQPDYEIRHVRQSDPPCFAPLLAGDWAALEQQYGVEAVEAAFAKLSKFPNLFTA